MSDEELNKLEHAAQTYVMGGLEWRLGEALASVRAERDALRKWKEDNSEAMRVFARYRELEAERDALREKLKAALVRQEYFDEELEVAEGRIWEEITTADATIIRLRGLLQEAVDEEVWPDDLATRIRAELRGAEK